MERHDLGKVFEDDEPLGRVNEDDFPGDKATEPLQKENRAKPDKSKIKRKGPKSRLLQLLPP